MDLREKLKGLTPEQLQQVAEYVEKLLEQQQAAVNSDRGAGA